jgi:hypothetical protein
VLKHVLQLASCFRVEHFHLGNIFSQGWCSQTYWTLIAPIDVTRSLTPIATQQALCARLNRLGVLLLLRLVVVPLLQVLYVVVLLSPGCSRHSVSVSCLLYRHVLLKRMLRYVLMSLLFCVRQNLLLGERNVQIAIPGRRERLVRHSVPRIALRRASNKFSLCGNALIKSSIGRLDLCSALQVIEVLWDVTRVLHDILLRLVKLLLLRLVSDCLLTLLGLLMLCLGLLYRVRRVGCLRALRLINQCKCGRLQRCNSQ